MTTLSNTVQHADTDLTHEEIKVLEIYENLLIQLAAYLDLPRHCLGMYFIESQLFIAHAKFGRYSDDQALTVAVAALAGRTLSFQLTRRAATTLEFSSTHPVRDMKQFKAEALQNISAWLQSLSGNGGDPIASRKAELVRLHDHTYPIITLMPVSC